jgi:3-dehydroquinate synthase
MSVVIPVRPAGAPDYDVVIGSDWHDALVAAVAGAARVAVIHAPGVSATAASLLDLLSAQKVTLLEVPDGEAAKDLAVAATLWDRLGSLGFTRSDAIIGLGGGATTDLAGFVAATWLRGVDVIQLATSTAGMVDAALGGKTAINIGAGKNLVGAFHHPRLVICDLVALATLPVEHHRAGMAEIIKTGFIADEAILTAVEKDPAAALDPADPVIAELVERSVRVKAEVVSEDPREAGRREILNYGHTLGHAIERAENYRWRHGDAVSVGMIFAAALGVSAGLLDGGTAARHRSTLESVGLPVTYRGDRAALLASMRVDKKSRADRLRFVVLTGVGAPVILDNPEPAWLDAAFAAVGS